jgi:hypothetical protein
VRKLLPFFLLISGTVSAFGQTLTPTQAQALVTRVLAVELRAAQDTSHPMRYRLHKSTPRLTTTKEMVETRDGDVARLVSVNNQPLSPADEQKEETRLSALWNDSSLQQRRKRSEEKDASRALNILRQLPLAFLYQFAGTGMAPSGPVNKFSFKPNPRYSPPDIESELLTAMTGEIWIDAAQERVVHLEGHLQQDKNFVWGILGQLNKGGWIAIDQADVGRHQWRTVRMRLKMTGRVFFKTKSFDSDQEYTNFSPIPAETDYRQAIQMLRSNPYGTGRGH